MLDTVLAASRAPPAGNNERVRTLDHGDAIRIQREQVVHGHGQVVQVGDKGPIPVDHDFAVTAPTQTLDSGQLVVDCR